MARLFVVTIVPYPVNLVDIFRHIGEMMHVICFGKKGVSTIFVASNERILRRCENPYPTLQRYALIIVALPYMLLVIRHFEFDTRRKFCIIFHNKYVRK